jgi:hypothetical protein
MLQKMTVQRLKGDNLTTGLPSVMPVTHPRELNIISSLKVKTAGRKTRRGILVRKRLRENGKKSKI